VIDGSTGRRIAAGGGLHATWRFALAGPLAAALVAVGCGEPAALEPEPPAVYETARFRIVDSTHAPQALIDSITLLLEADLDRVLALLPDFPPPDTVWTLMLVEGYGMPFVDLADATLWQLRSSLDLDYFPHQMTHLLTEYPRRPFLEEGLAVWATEQLRPASRTVHPYRGQPPHAWVSLFQEFGSQIPISVLWDADNLGFDVNGSSADASAWQLFIEAGSFARWVMETYGRASWFYAYEVDDLAGAIGVPVADLQAGWLAATRAQFPVPLACEEALGTRGPLGSREQYWCARARGE
jgi:hypothetical protein